MTTVTNVRNPDFDKQMSEFWWFYFLAKWHKIVLGKWENGWGNAAICWGNAAFCWGNEAICWGNEANLLGKWSKFVGEMKQNVFGRCPQGNVNTTLYDTSHCHYCPNPRMCLSSTAPLLLQHWKFWLISEIRSKIRFKIKHSIRHLRVIQQTIMISARLQWVVGCWRPRAGWRETALLGSKIASHRTLQSRQGVKCDNIFKSKNELQIHIVRLHPEVWPMWNHVEV